MHPVKQAFGGAAVFAAVLGLGAAAGSLVPGDEPGARSVSAEHAVTQLASRWTKRSVLDLSTGRRVLVGPCTFRHMWMNGNADLSRPSDRRRGDWWAIHHGCEPQPGQSLYVHPTGLTEVR